jgi:hypothetical protein
VVFGATPLCFDRTLTLFISIRRCLNGNGSSSFSFILSMYCSNSVRRAAGVAAVWIDADGHVGAHDVASIQIRAGRTVYCCERGVHFTLAYRLYKWKKGVDAADRAAIVAKLEDLAERGGVGLTPHQVAVDRALAAVAAVTDAIGHGRSGRAARAQCRLQGGAEG